MTAARDDDFMALPGMEADSTDAHHGRERLSGDTATTSPNTSPNASSKSALDALLDEYRARAKSKREKGTLSSCHIVVDTSSAPWGKRFLKVSHPHVRAKSPIGKYCRGYPQSYSHQDFTVASQGSIHRAFEQLSPKKPHPGQRITTNNSL